MNYARINENFAPSLNESRFGTLIFCTNDGQLTTGVGSISIGPGNRVLVRVPGIHDLPDIIKVKLTPRQATVLEERDYIGD